MKKVYEPSGALMFSEKQHFPKWLSWLMLAPVMFTAGIIVFIRTQEDVNETEMKLALGLVILVQAILFIWFLRAQLEKVVTSNGLYYRWSPLQKKYRVIEKEEIKGAELRKSPLSKYGSNYVLGYGRVHKVGPGLGVQVFMSNGKKIFFSAADAGSFQKALDELVISNRKIRWSEF